MERLALSRTSFKTDIKPSKDWFYQEKQVERDSSPLTMVS